MSATNTNEFVHDATLYTPVDSVGDVNKYNNITTTSGKIRAMVADGYTRGAIAKALGIRYQHVRNVLVQPLKK
jgi:hypothetical protein